MCQDWGGPIGLRQAVDMPERFERLVILNTWLHHDGYEYGDAIHNWRRTAERLSPDMPAGRVVAGTLARPGHDLDAVGRAYDAPFAGPESKAGIRRFPFCLPFAEPDAGNAKDQQRCFDALKKWDGPVNVIFGDADPIFPTAWGERWAGMIPGATFETIRGAGHFVQEDAGVDLAAAIVARIGEVG